MRKLVLAVAALGLVGTASPAEGQDWGNKLFNPDPNAGPTAHDFGGVPRGAQLYHRFAMKNIWTVPIELMNVRVSCGCVTATPSKTKLQPRETGYLDVTMDTRRINPPGPKTVTVHVLIGPEFTSTATLQVSCNCRADVVFNPGQINFGVVPASQTPTQNIDVEYAGSLDWKVSDINTNGAPVTAVLDEWYRRPGNPGQFGYHVRVTLKPDAPAGAHKWELLLKTNDPASPHVPLLVEATVQATLSVSPGVLNLGNCKVGDPAQVRRVVVRASKPFKVVAVEGLGEDMQVELPAGAAQQQFVTIKFQPTKAGELRRVLKVKTDLETDAPLTVTVEGMVDP
jgi:hypothetical protein